MPTGYTADVQSGKVTQFEDFAMQCARAFGALIMMRDEPHSAPIPERFEPSDHSAKQVRRLKDELASVLSLTEDGARVEAKREFDAAMASYQKNRDDMAQQRARYEAMLEKARMWEPPTPDHAPLRDFMVKQLSESIDFDCSGRWLKPPVLATPELWRAERIANLERQIAYHEDQQASEFKRTEERNAWLRSLRESLSPTPAESP